LPELSFDRDWRVGSFTILWLLLEVKFHLVYEDVAVSRIPVVSGDTTLVSTHARLVLNFSIAEEFVGSIDRECCEFVHWFGPLARLLWALHACIRDSSVGMHRWE
jgi:hypothetical protein